MAGPVAADSDLGLRPDDLEAIQSGLDAAAEIVRSGATRSERRSGPRARRPIQNEAAQGRAGVPSEAGARARAGIPAHHRR